ncbi:MAG: SusC/RagA family TonB-linked outer membrane protein [Rikenellaceae bacterium]|nr:SusC/RagA family TonB-linked outer membrane protein [Rikenellaceae bacterium]MCL2692283.1 SusC/RagA family TonB-linked outer membrane protein [Rikenellaceae bacterium]
MKEKLTRKRGAAIRKALRTMKLAAFCLFLFGAVSSATALSQTRLSIEVSNARLADVLDEIAAKTGYGFVYSNSELRGQERVSATFTNAEIDVVLAKVLENTGLWYVIEDRMVVISPKIQQPQPTQPSSQPSQRTVVTGRVTNAQGEPLLGVTVVVKSNRTIGVTTDVAGMFRLSVPDARNAVLLFSFVGMRPQEIALGDRTELTVTMEQAAFTSEQVIVTGMGSRDPLSYTGSVTQLTGEELGRISPGNILAALAQVDPGFSMYTSNVAGSNPNAIPEYNLRGQAGLASYANADDVILRGDLRTRPNQPLFVLDGIIGVSVTTIMDLDPTQVATLTLLKDAAATVIYGSEAANGVVVIETKPPAPGQLRFSYNGNFGLSIPDLGVYDLLNAAEKLELEELAGYYRNMPNQPALQDYYNRIKHAVLSGVDTYWIKEPVRTAFTHRHTVNMEGGDNALLYKVTLGAGFAPGVMKGTNLDTKTGRVELRYRRNNLLISNVVTVDHTNGTRLSPYGNFQEYADMNPYLRPRDENGNIPLILLNPVYRAVNGVTEHVGHHGLVLNPLYNTLFNQKNDMRELQLRNNMRVEYRPWNHVRLFADFAITGANSLVEVFRSAQHTSFYVIPDPQQKGSFDQQRADRWDYHLQSGASYNRAMGDHTLLVDFRYSIRERQQKATTIRHTGFPNDRLSEVQMGATWANTGGSESTARSFGALLSANYLYKHRYAVDFSTRVDASSEFGRNNRYAPFWSGGVRWNIDREQFVQNMNFFDELVLRATYGVTGSQGFTPYQTLQMYTYSGLTNLYKGFPVVGTELFRIGNPDLRWQQTDKMNFALDITVLRNLLSFRVEYYENYTKNSLLDYTLAPSVGFSTIVENLGRISNKGYELTARIIPYSDASKQAYWSIRATGGQNRSRIEQISNALKEQNEQNAVAQTTRPLPRFENGMSQTLIWAVRSAGIDPQTGREVFIKRDGTFTYDYDANDLVPVGDRAPKFAGSLSTDFTYKGFTVAVSSMYHWGGDLFNQTLIDKVENPNPLTNTDRRVLTERWREPGDQTFYKAINPNPNAITYEGGVSTRASSRFVMRNNEWALTSVSLAYRMDAQNSAFIRNLGFGAMTVTAYMQDLARISTIRMERGTEYPFARSVSMSLNILF